MITDEPAVNGWQAANEAHMARSTSAELRQVTAELDRVRADYDTVLLDRDQLARREADLEQALTNAGRELIAERQRAETFRTDRDQAWGQLADVARSSWIVARDGGRHCERCEGEVRRGEAYELQDGTGGLLLHIHCPSPEGRARRPGIYRLTDQGLAATETTYLDPKES